MEKWFLKKYKVKRDDHMKEFGETDTKKKVIRINVRKSKKTGQRGEVLDSILHETLHARHPRKSEKAIERMTSQSAKRLSKRSKNKLYKLIK